MESVVKHLPNTYYLELRQDYIMLCQSLTYRKSEKSKSSPHCKALILAVMEKWTNEKISKKKDLSVYMTHAQWIGEMYGLFGRNVIIDSLEELIEEGLIVRESYKAVRGGRDQYKYTLSYERLNKMLNPMFTNQPCEEEQSGKVNDQGLQVNVATSKSKSCSSSPTSKSKRFIESDTQNQSIKSEKESTLSRIDQLTDQEKRTYNHYCICFKKDMPRAPLPNTTEKFVQDIVALAIDVATQEEMQSLFDYAKVRIHGNNPRVYPANLLYWLDTWRREEKPLPWSQPDQPAEETSEESDILADRPLDYWTEETMEAANLTRIQRRTIRQIQEEQL